LGADAWEAKTQAAGSVGGVGSAFFGQRLFEQREDAPRSGNTGRVGSSASAAQTHRVQFHRHQIADHALETQGRRELTHVAMRIQPGKESCPLRSAGEPNR